MLMIEKLFLLLWPLIFLGLGKQFIYDKFILYEEKMKLGGEEQNRVEFRYCIYNTYSFIFILFNISYNKYIFLPKFIHNTIPVKLHEINEIYDIIYRSKFKYPTLDSLYHHTNRIQYECFNLSYIFLKLFL